MKIRKTICKEHSKDKPFYLVPNSICELCGDSQGIKGEYEWNGTEWVRFVRENAGLFYS